MSDENGTSRKGMSPVAAGAIALGSTVAGLTTGWILYSKFGINHNMHLPPALNASRKEFRSPDAGRLSYYVDRTREGTPLLLIHSVNAAASAYEMRPLFLHYRDERPVYALDLPGYGFSQRGDRDYTPKLMTDAVLALLERIEQPADIVALSLGSEFAALAALEAQDRIRSLTLISPTGFKRSSETAQNALQMVTDATRRGSQVLSRVGSVAGPQAKNLEAGVSAAGDVTRFIQSGKVSDVGYQILTFSLWARPIFDLLTTRPTIRYYLGKSFSGTVPEAFVDYAYNTAHRPGAHHAPLSFISGRLFTPNVRDAVYDQVTRPTLVLYNEDPYTTFETLPAFLSRRATWQAQRIRGTLGLPHWEQLIATTRALDGFWATVDEAAPDEMTPASEESIPRVP